jgi:hypothetical protein
MGRHSIAEDRSFLRSLIFFALKWAGLALIPLLVLRFVWGAVTPDEPKPKPAADSSPQSSNDGTPGTESPASPTPAASPAPAGPLPKLQVLNGTDKDGVAKDLAALLRQAGREVVNVEKALKPYAKTTIFYQPGFEQAAKDLAGTVGGQVQAATPNLSKEIPLTVVVGADYTPPEAAPAPAATGSPAPAATPTATTTAVTVQVLNGTDVKGLGGRAAEKLRTKGYEVVAVKNAVNMYETTIVYYQPGFQRTASEVVAVLGTGSARPAPANLQKDIPLSVVVGKDYA